MCNPPMASRFEAMGWIVVGIVLFAVYAVFMFGLAGLSVAMDGARKKPPTAWSGPGMWLILLAVPLWGPIVWPINRLGYRVPVLGAPFTLGGRRRRVGAQASGDVGSGDDLA
jgi:hypothetical protein